jgi:hypothetical protein
MLGTGLDLFRLANGSIPMSPINVPGQLAAPNHLLSCLLAGCGLLLLNTRSLADDERDGFSL